MDEIDRVIKPSFYPVIIVCGEIDASAFFPLCCSVSLLLCVLFRSDQKKNAEQQRNRENREERQSVTDMADSCTNPSQPYSRNRIIHMKTLLLFLSSLFTLTAAADLKVALILPGSDTDKGWNQMAKEGLDAIKKDLKAQTKAVTNVKSSDFYNQISNFAEDGYDLIICHGGEFAKAAAQAARPYPKAKSIVGGRPVDIKGAVAVEFLTRDASELVGFVAGKVSK